MDHCEGHDSVDNPDPNKRIKAIKSQYDDTAHMALGISSGRIASILATDPVADVRIAALRACVDNVYHIPTNVLLDSLNRDAEPAVRIEAAKALVLQWNSHELFTSPDAQVILELLSPVPGDSEALLCRFSLGDRSALDEAMEYLMESDNYRNGTNAKWIKLAMISSPLFYTGIGFLRKRRLKKVLLYNARYGDAYFRYALPALHALRQIRMGRKALIDYKCGGSYVTSYACSEYDSIRSSIGQVSLRRDWWDVFQ